MRRFVQRTLIAATAGIGLCSGAARAAPPAADHPAATQSGAGAEMQGQVEVRIADLHNRLQITLLQQPQWAQFSQVMRDNARDIDQIVQQRVQTLAAMTATENMQSYAQVATEHAQDMRKLVPVFQALYDTMSTAQKLTADQVFRSIALEVDRKTRG
jgi:hypothetical protein